jgi:signal transduction histidine kinase
VRVRSEGCVGVLGLVGAAFARRKLDVIADSSRRMGALIENLLAFARMMQNRGVYGKDRILSRLSVELMTTDQLTPEQKAASPFFENFWDSRGWGLGLSIVHDVAEHHGGNVRLRARRNGGTEAILVLPGARPL